MALNYIWIGFFLVGLLVAIIRVAGYFLQTHADMIFGITFTHADRDVFQAIVQSTFHMAKTSVDLSIYLIGVMALWLGIMKIGEKGGAVTMLSKLVSPFFRKIFPEIPDKHPAMSSIMMNFCANMLGLDNAATPFGIKAMQDLQELNPKKDTASNAQIMFLVLNTSALTVIPISILAYRAAAHSANPAEVFLPLLLATFFSTMAGLIAVSIVQRINLFKPVVLLYLGVISGLIALLFLLLHNMSHARIGTFSIFSGNVILFFFIIFFLATGIFKRINVYEAFIEGAKEGFTVAVKIIPYLVAMLVGIGIFRASGAFDMLLNGIAAVVSWMGFDTSFVPALPVALMKPLSGSGARGLLLELFANPAYGPDSFAGRLASIFQGSSETTFYTVAVYYGAVNISKTRYTITCGLIADLAGIIAAIFIGYYFFF